MCFILAKKKKEKDVFNHEEAIQAMEIDYHIKTGFLYYIETNKLTFKSEKDLEKTFKQFMEN